MKTLSGYHAVALTSQILIVYNRYMEELMDTMLLRIEEVAARAAVSIQTVRRWIADGRLDSIRIGRTLRIRRTSLDALLGGPRN